jgi:hypothetical protein
MRTPLGAGTRTARSGAAPSYRREKVGRCDPSSGAGAACLLLLFAPGRATQERGRSCRATREQLPGHGGQAAEGEEAGGPRLQRGGCSRPRSGRRNVRHRACRQRLVAPSLSVSFIRVRVTTPIRSSRRQRSLRRKRRIQLRQHRSLRPGPRSPSSKQHERLGSRCGFS